MSAPKIVNLAQMTTPTVGTGTITLGVAAASYRTFSASGVNSGDTVSYSIVDLGQREYGTGVVTVFGSTVTMTRVLRGSTTGSLLSLSGNAIVSLTPAAEDLTYVVNYRADIPSIMIRELSFYTVDGAHWVQGTSAGAMAIQDASGQWWQLDLSKGYAHASWFGAMGDGITDDAPALNTATTAMANNGLGGGIVDLTGGRYLVDSADLVVHQGVTLRGPYDNFGEMGSGPNGNYGIVTSSIVLNSAYTIRLLKFCSVKGLVILRKGLTKPTDMRSAIDVGKAFAGTAITFGNGAGQVSSGIASDSYVGYCLIIGFQYAIVNYKNERPHIEYVSGDCTNGILFNFVTDMDHVSHIHFWPFAVAHVSGGVGISYNVTGTSNNGAGAIRLSLVTNVIAVGDTIIVQSVGGTTEANGRWVVSAVGAGYVDLTGSTYTNAWTSGGVVYLDNSKRLGAAFAFYNVVDWGQIDNSFCYGYDQGFIVDSCNDVVLLNCGVDAYATAADPTTIGYSWQNGAFRGTMIGCKGASHGYAVVQDVGSGNNSNASANLNMSACHFWGNNQGHLHVVNGRVTSIGCHYDSIVGPLSATAYSITVEGTSYGGVFIGNSSSRTNPITFTAGNAINASTVRNNRWPDPSTTGNREVYDNSQRNMYFGTYGSASGLSFIGKNARGSAFSPTATLTNDTLFSWAAQSYDGTNFTNSAIIRVTSDGGATTGATPGKIILSTTPAAAAVSTDWIALNSAGTFFPITDNTISLGATGQRWTAVWAANGTIQTSDERDKTDVEISSLGLSFIKSLRPVSYKWKIGGRDVVRQVYTDSDGNEIPEGEEVPDGSLQGRIITVDKPGTRTHWGFIAQEVKKVCDDAGVDFGGWVLSDMSDKNSQQALRYDQFIAPLVKAVQELSARLEALEKIHS